MKNNTLLLICLALALLLAACSSGASSYTTVDTAAAAEALKAAEFDGEKTFESFNLASADYVDDVLAIDTERLASYSVLIPAEDDDCCMALLLIPLEGEYDTVKNQLTNSMSNYQKRWDNYLPEKAYLVSGRMETEIGDCLVCLISPDNDAALDAVRSAAS
ncbi:MAG: hypothetical protein Q4B42_02830 [Oscillospiraceae bacterium]|nr:hypothetical protein [Oscillospiraceae bacterium]